MGVCPLLSGGASARVDDPLADHAVELQPRVDYSYVTTVQEREMSVYRWLEHADQKHGDQTYTCDSCQAVWFYKEPDDKEAHKGVLEAWHTVDGQRFVSDHYWGRSRWCDDCGSHWVME